jgi:NDP-sugar pyrophosphorylase family protein
MKIAELYDLDHTLAKKYLQNFVYPWEALAGISDLILALGAEQNADFVEIAPQVWVHKTAKIAPTAYIGAPCIIGANTEVRHCAFIRGSALIGENCVVGNSAELKNVILFDGVQTPHYNYIGDSILGYKAHFGAGSLTSNVRGDKALVKVGGMETGRKKVGAFVGDFGEIGCNAVLNPGVVIGRNSQVYPTSCVRGVVPENSMYKNNGTIVPKNA